MTSRLRGELALHEDPAALSVVARKLRLAGHPVVLVPTMGALHAGHRALIRAARAIPGGRTVVSIYLNPLQFGSRHDLDRYPRSFDADLAMCREEGVELVFAPSVAAMSPAGGDTTGDTTVEPGALGAQLEGAGRAGHFAAVLTVVAKLFGIVAPDRALFGEKDYQQLVLVQRMVADLRMDVQVLGVPTVREADGLALSSRNVHLDAEARGAAVALSAALSAGAQAGVGGPDAVLAAAGEVLAGQPAVALDYLALRNPKLGPAPAQGSARLLLSATVGTTRLIDNVGLRLGPDSNGRGAP
ncbi:MAG: pantoate--beta-alanine ligase [Actinomycetota bacterium]|nr:pantoate--beta-alanine ligase [Actinomycetota bacterium]